jgi:hypothetical protein
MSNPVNKMANKRRKMLREVVAKGAFSLDGHNYAVLELPDGKSMGHSIQVTSEPLKPIKEQSHE